MKTKVHRSLAFSLVCSLLSSCGKSPNQSTGSQLSSASDGQEQGWTNAMAILKGYDVISSITRGDCTIPGIIDPVISDGNIGTWRIDFVTNSLDLQKSMDVSASARLSTATGASASAKAKFSNSIHVNSFSVYALASVQIEKPTTNYRDVKLKQVYADLLNSQNIDKMKIFRTRCGDKFIIGQKSGGEYQTLIEIKATSKEEKEAISASVKGKVGMYSASGSFASALHSLSQQYELHFTAFKVGGSNDPIPTDPEGIIKRAAGFEKEVDDRSVPFQAIVTDYETLENFPFENPISTASAVQVIESLNSTRILLETTRANIQYILSNQSQFKDVKGSYLSEKINVLNDAENKILTAARACAQNIDNCSLPIELGDISVNFPEWRDSSKPIQVFGPHESCGVESHKVDTGKVCGVESTVYNTGTGPSCGVKGYKYKEDRGEACGIEKINEGHGPFCGQSTWLAGDPNYSACVNAGGRVFTEWMMDMRMDYCTGDKTCQDSRFGVVYKSCESASFGIKETIYETCEHSSFGIKSETFKSCADLSFGVKEYKSCMHNP